MTAMVKCAKHLFPNNMRVFQAQLISLRTTCFPLPGVQSVTNLKAHPSGPLVSLGIPGTRQPNPSTKQSQ